MKTQERISGRRRASAAALFAILAVVGVAYLPGQSIAGGTASAYPKIYRAEREGFRIELRVKSDGWVIIRVHATYHCPGYSAIIFDTLAARLDRGTGEFHFRDRENDFDFSDVVEIYGRVGPRAAGGRYMARSNIQDEFCTTGTRSNPWVYFRARRVSNSA